MSFRRATGPAPGQQSVLSRKRQQQEEIYDIPFSSVAMGPEDLTNSYRNFFDTIKAKGNINGSEANLTTTFTTRADNESLVKDLGTIAKGLIGMTMSYVNTRVFPLVYTNDLQHVSKVIEFIDAYATPTPYLGVSRTFAYRQEEKVSQSTRYGTHFFMEADQFDTPEGQEFFSINMERMIQIIQNTYIEVGWAALMRPHPYKMHILMANVATRNEFLMALQREVEEFAQSYKSPYAIRTSVQLYSRILRERTGIKGVVLIMPDDKDTLITDPEMNTHDKLGERGVDTILSDGLISSINGVDIYPNLNPKNLDTPLDTRARVGRYHVFINRHRHMVQNGTFNYEKYMIDSIFNINTNQRDHMNFKRCNEHDGRWMIQGVQSVYAPPQGGGPRKQVHMIDTSIYGLFAGSGIKGPDLFIKKPDVDAEFQLDQNLLDPFDCTIGNLKDYLDPKFLEGVRQKAAQYVALLGSENVEDQERARSFGRDVFETQPLNGADFTQAQLNALTVEQLSDGLRLSDIILTKEFVTLCYNHQIPPPWGFLLFQPFDGYHMQSQVYACDKAGQTNVTEPSFSMGQDPQNFSYHFGCVAHAGVHVFDEQRIMIIQNQFYNGIISGGNTTLITPKQAEELRDVNFNPQADDLARPSIYVCSIPWYSLEEHLLNDAFIDITGKSQIDNDSDNVCHYPGAQFYGYKYGFNTIDNPYSINGEMQPIARITFQLHAKVVDHTGNSIMDIEGQGHHGKYEEPGHRQVRSLGAIKYPTASV